MPNPTTHPLAADILADQLDVYTLQGVEAHRRLICLRNYLRDGKGNTFLHEAITRAEREAAKAEGITADIRGALALLRAPAPPAIPFNLVAMDAVKAWVIPGPVPSYHEAMKARLRGDWPVLWHAMEALARYDGVTEYVTYDAEDTPEPGHVHYPTELEGLEIRPTGPDGALQYHVACDPSDVDGGDR